MYGTGLQPHAAPGYGTQLTSAPRPPRYLRRPWGATLAGPAGGYGAELRPPEPEIDYAPATRPWSPTIRVSLGGWGATLYRRYPGRKPQRDVWGLYVRGPVGGYGPELRHYLPDLAPEDEETSDDETAEVDWPVPPSSRTHAQVAGAWRFPGPPRANSPRQDPEWALLWEHPRAVDHAQRDTIQPARPVDYDHGTPWMDAPPRDRDTRTPYADGQPRDQAPRGPWIQPPPRDEGPRSPWQDGQPRDQDPRAPYIDAPPQDRSVRAPLEDLPHCDQALRHPHRDLPHRDRAARGSIAPARAADVRPRARFGTYGPQDHAFDIRWGKRPRQEVYVPPRRDYADAGALRFNLRSEMTEPARGLIPPGETPPDQPAGLYTRPTVEAHRLDDSGEPAEALTLESVQISTEIDSWAWDLRATIRDPAEARLIAPRYDHHPQIEVRLGGRPWQIVVDRLSIERRPDGEVRTIQGRSPTAILDQPYAPQRQQRSHHSMRIDELARQAITVDGEQPVALDWRPPTWRVPRDTHTYRQRTPLQALQQIATGLGLALYTPPAGDRIVVHRRSPRPVHQWRSAEGVRRIPISYITDAEGEWEDEPRYAVAWVQGTTAQGVTVRGYREAWDHPEEGARATSAKSSPIITTREAGRERARAELDASGPKLIDTITMPLADETGLAEPGELLCIYDGAAELTGLVRGVQLRASGGRIEQVVTLETRPESYTRDEDRREPWEAPAGDQLVMDLADDDIYLTRAGGWVVRPESGPRDAGIIIPTPDGDPIQPLEAD